MRGGFDLRFVIPIIINLLKSISGAHPWDWDAFGLLKYPNQTSWTKVSFHVLQLLFFSSTSITFILRFRPWYSVLIRFRFGDFSPHIAVSHVCSLVFPQALFWDMYPATLVVNHFLGWLNVKLSALPVWNLHISSTFTSHEETDAHPFPHIVESEVPVAQVSISVSPGDSDSAAEG